MVFLEKTGGIATLLMVMVVGCALLAGSFASRGEPYFDPALYRNLYPCSIDERMPLGPLDPYIEDWFAQPLRATREPSLYFASDLQADQKTTLRFTFLPSFSHPVIVRIEDVYGERPRLIATRFVWQVTVREGPDHLVRHLNRDEIMPIISLMQTSGVLALQPDSCLSGLDGEIYLIEARGPNGYRFINRWGVGSGPVYDLASAMYGLTGWPNGRQGPIWDHTSLAAGSSAD